MSKIPTPAGMDPKKSIYSNSRASSKKVAATPRPHVCPRTTELAALKSRIGHLETIIVELRSRNDTRDIEKLLQKNTIDHQSKLLEIIDRNIATKGGMEKDDRPNQRQDEIMKKNALLLDIRTNFIEHLLQNEESVRNLLQEKQSNEIIMRQTENLLLEKEKMIDILRAVIHEKDSRLAELEMIRNACEDKDKMVDQNRVNMEERIGNLLTENLRYRTLCSLTRM